MKLSLGHNPFSYPMAHLRGGGLLELILNIGTPEFLQEYWFLQLMTCFLCSPDYFLEQQDALNIVKDYLFLATFFFTDFFFNGVNNFVPQGRRILLQIRQWTYLPCSAFTECLSSTLYTILISSLSVMYSLYTNIFLPLSICE